MFAALHFVDLSVHAALKASPTAWRQPSAVLALDAGAIVEKVKLPLLAVNDAARQTGIDAGWPLNRALVRCPGLQVLPPQPEHGAALLVEMIALAETLTPDLEIATPDTLILDLSRATARQSGKLDWLEMADGGELRHVRANTPDLACLGVRVADRHGDFISPQTIQSLPLEMLGALAGGSQLLDLLENWGLETLGDFMRLPRQALTARLGATAGDWHDLLHEKKPRLLKLHRPPENLTQTLDLEHPAATSETLVFAFQRLLAPLTARLRARHVAARALRLGFQFEDGAEMERILRLPEPRTEALLDPVQLLLENLKLPAAVMGISLDVETADPEAAQRDAFKRELARPQQWQETLARLEALLGEQRVGIPEPPGDHRPDSFQLRHPSAAPAEKDAWPTCPVPLRRYRPPYEIHVAHAPGPRPLALLSGPYRGEILRFRGPFRHSGNWWDETAAWQQMEWDVELPTGFFRLAYLPPERWCLEGDYGSSEH